MRQMLYFSVSIRGLNELPVVWKSSRGIRDAKKKMSWHWRVFAVNIYLDFQVLASAWIPLFAIHAKMPTAADAQGQDIVRGIVLSY